MWCGPIPTAQSEYKNVHFFYENPTRLHFVLFIGEVIIKNRFMINLTQGGVGREDEDVKGVDTGRIVSGQNQLGIVGTDECEE